MKRAILIFGPQSSGTRLLTSIFIDAGFYGNCSHSQELDIQVINNTIPENINNIVWRRSFPHAHKWPNIKDMVSSLKKIYFDDISCLVTTRDWYSNVCSLYLNDKENYNIQDIKQQFKNVLNNIKTNFEDKSKFVLYKGYSINEYNLQLIEAYQRIFLGLNENNIPFRTISYEMLILNPNKVIKNLFDWFNVEYNEIIQKKIIDENSKYYL